MQNFLLMVNTYDKRNETPLEGNNRGCKRNTETHMIVDRALFLDNHVGEVCKKCS